MRRVVAILWGDLISLLAVGLVLVFSASSSFQGGPLPFVIMQAIAACIGLALAFVVIHIDYRIWRNLGLISAVGFVAVVFSGLVFLFPEVNGSHRWIRLGPLSLQPSEFSRIAAIVAMSAWFDRIGPRSTSVLKGALFPALILGAFVLPVFASPDVGATIVILVSCGTIFVAAGVKWRHLAMGGLVAVIALALFISSDAHRRSRVITYVDSLRGIESEQETAYHRNQSIEAFVIGGPFGVGLGNSIQKKQYLPEANTDFIFAIAGEEFGLADLVILALFLVLLWAGVYVAYHAHDRFGRFLALGMTVLLVFEAAFNIGMATGCLPTKGLALPFNSYGGTSLMASFVAFGFILSVARASADEESSSMMRDAQIDFS